jgi:hypothetical protein
MKIARIAAFSLLVLASGCHTWTHAPGSELPEAAHVETFALETPQMCQPGVCDLKGPNGKVSFSEVSSFSTGNRRDSTAFHLDYRDWKALCRGPADASSRPFECTLMERGTGASATLAVGAACTRAQLTYSGGRTLELRTDVVEVLGHESPGREVALLENGQVVTFSERRGGGDVVFRHGGKSTLPTEQALALLAMHAYQQMEGHPPECLVQTNKG